MSWSKKINSKTYSIGVAGNMILAVILGYPDYKSIGWLFGIIVAAFINHYSSVYVVSKLFEKTQGNAAAINKAGMIFNLFLKGLSLIVGFYGLVTYARNMVLQGLLLYIFQLIILGLSIKNIENLIKKGPLK